MANVSVTLHQVCHENSDPENLDLQTSDSENSDPLKWKRFKLVSILITLIVWWSRSGHVNATARKERGI